MRKHIKLGGLLVLAALSAVLFLPSNQLQAEERSISSKSRGQAYRVAPTPRIGGYSTTLSDIWGEPVMPAPPKDFGPHFDFPPASLNGPPNRDPYPN